MKRYLMGPGRIPAILVVLVLMSAAALEMPSSRLMPGVKADSTLGGPLPNLTSLETNLFNTGIVEFDKIWDPVQGLGPVYTQTACTGCHSNPIRGGVSGVTVTHFGKTNLDGSFNPLTEEGGDVLEPQSMSKFKKTCVLAGETVPADATIVSIRQSQPLFGDGLINSITEADILANAVDRGMGIHGVANMVPDENGVTHVGRFGRKAQFADVLQISATAFLNDIGITTPLLPTENLPQGKPIPQTCQVAPEPNDDGHEVYAVSLFVEYLAPPVPGVGNANGQALFTSVGCALCHQPSYTTAPRVSLQIDDTGRIIMSKALSNQPVNLYSDLLLHDLGTLDGDGVPQGQASATQWRTAPLWGLSLRNKYMHGGGSPSLNAAIAAHGGEATTVINNFNALKHTDQTDLISFLQSL
ncbi:MAG: hypothetical protein H0X25_08690 [Acidobacteriales bacterium]|nr:hypothetical protein [Terriglobales bacterium]